MKKMSNKFRIGDNVIYVPQHAEGNINHKDCERGTVSSCASSVTHVFVKYVRNGVPQQTAERTPITLLVKA